VPFVQELVAEAHRGADEALGALEDVRLPAADDRDRPGHDRHSAVVEQVMAGALAGPDQLVVVVAMRLARLVACDLQDVEQHDLHGVVAVGETVDGEPARGARGLLVAQDAHARCCRGRGTEQDCDALRAMRG